jgi:hypothetical protein
LSVRSGPAVRPFVWTSLPGWGHDPQDAIVGHATVLGQVGVAGLQPYEALELLSGGGLLYSFHINTVSRHSVDRHSAGCQSVRYRGPASADDLGEVCKHWFHASRDSYYHADDDQYHE